jgi:PAS domain S-box-containing protein
MFAHLPGIAVFVFDSELRVELADGPALFEHGHDPLDLTGRTLPEVVPAAVRNMVLPACRDAVAGRSTSMRLRTADGERVFDVDVTPLEDDDGEVDGGMLVARDVTDRHNREVLGRALRLQDDERARIATQLHDDTIQVMAASLMALDRLQRRADHPDPSISETRRVLSEAVERTRRMAFGLRPPLLVVEGLQGAVPALARRYSTPGRMEVGARVAVSRHDETVETLVYRTVQDLLEWLQGSQGTSRIQVVLDEVSDGSIRGALEHDAATYGVCVPAAERVGLAGGSLTSGDGAIRFELPPEPLPA